MNALRPRSPAAGPRPHDVTPQPRTLERWSRRQRFPFFPAVYFGSACLGLHFMQRTCFVRFSPPRGSGSLHFQHVTTIGVAAVGGDSTGRSTFGSSSAPGVGRPMASVPERAQSSRSQMAKSSQRFAHKAASTLASTRSRTIWNGWSCPNTQDAVTGCLAGCPRPTQPCGAQSYGRTEHPRACAPTIDQAGRVPSHRSSNRLSYRGCLLTQIAHSPP